MMVYKNQHRLKDREVQNYTRELKAKLGDSPFTPGEGVDIAESSEGKVILVDKKPLATFFDEEIFPTVEGLLKMEADARYVTVDMGAVKYIYNGADVMSPGIVETDEAIREGQLVWVRDNDHGKPLAVGRALISGVRMVKEEKGKAVETLHHVGDDKF